MKNVFLVPTDKPSRLYFNKNDKCFQLCQVKKQSTLLKPNQNIYITNNEEVKANEWFYSPELKRRQVFGHDNIPKDRGFKKIILTTDQDLIKDGVQAIPDEFLQWFVKNSSCEFIKITKTSKLMSDFLDGLSFYKIIIPKENGLKITKVSVLNEDGSETNIINNPELWYINSAEETLEEVADWLNKKFNGKGVEIKVIDQNKNEKYNYSPSNLLQEYAKYQAERSYDELSIYLQELADKDRLKSLTSNQIRAMIEQFKKK